MIQNEYYKFVTTKKYPLYIPNPLKPPVIEKTEELGKKESSDEESSVEDKCS